MTNHSFTKRGGTRAAANLWQGPLRRSPEQVVASAALGVKESDLTYARNDPRQIAASLSSRGHSAQGGYAMEERIFVTKWESGTLKQY